jgi:hypothetical protein
LSSLSAVRPVPECTPSATAERKYSPNPAARPSRFSDANLLGAGATGGATGAGRNTSITPAGEAILCSSGGSGAGGGSRF